MVEIFLLNCHLLFCDPRAAAGGYGTNIQQLGFIPFEIHWGFFSEQSALPIQGIPGRPN